MTDDGDPPEPSGEDDARVLLEALKSLRSTPDVPTYHDLPELDKEKIGLRIARITPKHPTKYDFKYPTPRGTG